jgi:hypothetical protein
VEKERLEELHHQLTFEVKLAGPPPNVSPHQTYMFPLGHYHLPQPWLRGIGGGVHQAKSDLEKAKQDCEEEPGNTAISDGGGIRKAFWQVAWHLEYHTCVFLFFIGIVSKMHIHMNIRQ